MLKKVSRAATPDVEDEVLLHLLDTRYTTHSVSATELDNFLAVSKIDVHRTKPLDEEAALMLAQSFAEFQGYYPYFTELTAVDTPGFRSFFTMAGQIQHLPVLQQQMALGEFNALAEWVVLLKRGMVIDDAEAARLFKLICDREGAASGEGVRATVSIDLAQTILGHCGTTEATWDDTLRNCLLGRSANGVDERGKDYQIVLDEQKAPSLDVMRSIVSSARGAASPGASRPVMIKTSAALPRVGLPREVRLIGKEKDVLLLYDPANLQRLVEEWNANAARYPANAKTAQKLSGQLLKEAEPQMVLALMAPVYAYFFRGTDLVMTEDPLFLRKHRFSDFDSPGQHLILESRFRPDSDGLGSRLEGGMAHFGLASAFAVASGWKQGGQGGPAVIAEQIAAIRGADWGRALESDQRLVTLRILAAREWIVQSAQNPALYTALSEETAGLLSLSRRADLLNGIEERDWQQVWSSITLPDLFRLGGNYMVHSAKGDAASPVLAQLRSVMASNSGERLDIFSRIPNHVLGCSHTHLVPDAPYEEYERQMEPSYMAERTAEFKLFLVYRADSLGIPPSSLPQVGEKLAAQAFTKSHMSDYHDWQSLLTAYASVTNDDLKRALEP